MRYERKAVVDINELGLVQASVLKHPLAFRKQFPDRKVHSVYVDSVDFDFLQMNVMGSSNRQKWRIRWYGDGDDKVPMTLERKYKHHMLGAKQLHSLGEFSSKDWLFAFQKTTSIVEKVFPVAKVSYDRQYYISSDDQLRLTIDTAINYQKIQDNQLQYLSIEEAKLVIELKYDQSYETELTTTDIAKFPFRITKNSKYVNAMKAHWF